MDTAGGMPPRAGGPHGRAVFAAVLLAAGSGSRIGHRPKCLLELDGVPLIRRLVGALAGAGVDEVVVVTGHHAEFVEPVLRPLRVALVRNPDPDAGPVSSQRLGLAALSGRPDALIVALADQPLIGAQDIAALIDAWTRRPAGTQVVYPEVEDAGGAAGGGGTTRSRGNPVIFSAEVRDQILADAAGVGCRQWQAAHPAQVAAFVTDNRHYKVDIDTLEDLARFECETGRALRWPTGGHPA
jgi:CTP:molybdopterin cytidylyltransferase MocA